MSDIVERLNAPEWRGPRQHLRGWDELDALHADAADEIERLREALREISQQDPIELALDPQWSQRIARAALGEGDVNIS